MYQKKKLDITHVLTHNIQTVLLLTICFIISYLLTHRLDVQQFYLTADRTLLEATTPA